SDQYTNDRTTPRERPLTATDPTDHPTHRRRPRRRTAESELPAPTGSVPLASPRMTSGGSGESTLARASEIASALRSGERLRAARGVGARRSPLRAYPGRGADLVALQVISAQARWSSAR